MWWKTKCFPFEIRNKLRCPLLLYLFNTVVIVQLLSHVRLFVTPWTIARGSSVHGISQARILEWVAISFSRRSSWPRDQTRRLTSSAFVWTSVQFSSVQSLSRVRLFATPWIAARQASLSITNPRSSLRLTSIEPVMPSSQWCHPAISSSVIPFSSCPQSLPASESFPMSHTD